MDGGGGGEFERGWGGVRDVCISLCCITSTHPTNIAFGGRVKVCVSHCCLRRFVSGMMVKENGIRRRPPHHHRRAGRRRRLRRLRDVDKVTAATRENNIVRCLSYSLAL